MGDEYDLYAVCYLFYADQIIFIFLWQNDVGDIAALGCQYLIFDATDWHYLAAEIEFTGRSILGADWAIG